MPKFRVDLYYSTYQSVEVGAVSEEEALKKSREAISQGPIAEVWATECLGNAERWTDADEVEEIG